MPRYWVSWTLFFSSYTPLFVLLAIRSVGREKGEPVMIMSAALVLLGAIGTVLFLTAADRKSAGNYELISVESRDADVASYAATYILPFVTDLNGGWRDLVSLGAFVLFLGVIYVRSRLIYVNPILFVMGYHLWRVIPQTQGADRSSKQWPAFLLADEPVIAGATISAHWVSPDLLLLKKTKKSG